MENLKVRAQAAEEAAREAYVVETEAEDASRLADGALQPLVEGAATAEVTWTDTCLIYSRLCSL